MAKETEIKLRIEDLPELRKKLRQLKARIAVPRTLEHNILFDTARADLKKREQLLRIRTETPGSGSKAKRNRANRVLVTFKQPARDAKAAATRHKTREEIEFEASNSESLSTIFEAVGLRLWFRYEKFRTTYHLPSQKWAARLLIELDETPIGVFLELEGPGSAIDRAAKALGFAENDYILANYIELYRQFRRKQPEHSAAEMTFRTARPAQGRRESKKIF